MGRGRRNANVRQSQSRFIDDTFEIDQSKFFGKGEVSLEKILPDIESKFRGHPIFPLKVQAADFAGAQDVTGAGVLWCRGDGQFEQEFNGRLKIDLVELHQEIHAVSVLSGAEVHPFPRTVFIGDGERRIAIFPQRGMEHAFVVPDIDWFMSLCVQIGDQIDLSGLGEDGRI